MHTRGIFVYNEEVIDPEDPFLPEYEKLSAVKIDHPFVTNLTHGSYYQLYRLYEKGVVVFLDNNPIYVSGTFTKTHGAHVDYIVDPIEVDPMIITKLINSAYTAKGKRVHIRGRRGGLAKYPGYTYWKCNYPNVRSNINVKV